MKLFLLISIFFSISTLVHAEDIWGNCYINNDEGYSLALSSEFVDHKAFMNFDYKDITYEIILIRSSSFGEYLYFIKRGNKKSSLASVSVRNSFYGSVLKLNSEISCIAVD